MPHIYARLEICADNLLLLRPLVARLAIINDSFWFFSASSTSSMHSDVHFCFSVLSPAFRKFIQGSRNQSWPFICSLLLFLSSLAIQSCLLRLPVAVIGFLVFCCPVIGLSLVHFSFSYPRSTSRCPKMSRRPIKAVTVVVIIKCRFCHHSTLVLCRCRIYRTLLKTLEWGKKGKKKRNCRKKKWALPGIEPMPGLLKSRGYILSRKTNSLL